MDSNRLELIRGRLGRDGIHNMTLSTFLDIVWAEIWDDCSPMGDRGRYRQIILELFVEGKEPYNITWKDEKGKTHRLSDTPATKGAKPSRGALDQARGLQEMLQRARAAVVESTDNE